MEIPIPKNLKDMNRNALKRVVRAMQKAIAAECRRCLGVENLRGIKDCSGLNLDDGNCPLYEFSPFGQRQVVSYHSERVLGP